MSTKSRGAAAKWLSEDEEGAWRGFRRMMVAVRSKIARDLAETGLSEPDYEVLSTLTELPMTTSTLHAQAAKMGWSKSRLSRHAARMEMRGLIVKRPDPEDGRGCLLTLSKEGRDALREATPTHMDSVRKHFADRLDERDLADLERIANKLAPAEN